MCFSHQRNSSYDFDQFFPSNPLKCLLHCFTLASFKTTSTFKQLHTEKMRSAAFLTAFASTAFFPVSKTPKQSRRIRVACVVQ